MSSAIRILSCLFLLSYSAAVSAQVIRPNFDQGVDSAKALQGLKADGPAAPAFKASDQNVFVYRLDHYPKSSGPCVSIAQKIGQDLARIAGVKVVKSVCSGEDKTGYKISVSYEAPEQLELVSTARGLFPHGGFGGTASLEACKAGLADEAKLFQEATGLEPVAAYCFSDPLPDEKDVWSIRIDSFGHAKLTPDVEPVPLSANPQGWTKEQFTGHIKDKLKEQGVNVRSVVWRPGAGYATLEVGYYASERLDLKFEEPASLFFKEDCAAMKAELDKHLAGRQEPLIHFCGISGSGWSELSWLFKGKPPLKTVKASDKFKSYQDCLAGRDKVIQYYRESMGHDVAGALCSYEVDVIDGSGWQAVLLEP